MITLSTLTGSLDGMSSSEIYSTYLSPTDYFAQKAKDSSSETDKSYYTSLSSAVTSAYNTRVETEVSIIDKNDSDSTMTDSVLSTASSGGDLSDYSNSELTDALNYLTVQNGSNPLSDSTSQYYKQALAIKNQITANNSASQNTTSAGSSGVVGSTAAGTADSSIYLDTMTDAEKVQQTADKKKASEKAYSTAASGSAPWDVRLARADLFVYGNERVPFAADEAAPMLSDLIDYATDSSTSTGGATHASKGHVVPASKTQYRSLVNNPNVWGTLSLINPYSVTRLYNGLGHIQVSKKYAQAGVNRMLDIRDQKRFYDIRDTSASDVLSVSNPTTTNIINLMNNDKWGRTPYSYNDFVYCKYWNIIPNNRMITLRKYIAPTTDNLCWELMASDDNGSMLSSFAPICTMVTYFGGDSGNELKNIFSITSGLPWKDSEKAKIWEVTGDSGTPTQEAASKMMTSGWNGMSTVGGGLSRVFSNLGTISDKSLSFLKFFSMSKSPYAFDRSQADKEQLYIEGVHDPMENGPYSNRIQGPVNRVDQVMEREAGLTFTNDLEIKFSYKARAIGGVNSKAAMLDILSNVLLMCSGTAVFWGGGHRFKISPHTYPWTSTMSPGLAKDIYNGNFFGDTGAIAKVAHGLVQAGGSDGGWSWENASKMLANLGSSVLGVLSGAVNTLLGSISSKLADAASGVIGSLTGGSNGNGAYQKGQSMFTNIMQNTQNIWKSNALKQSVLPRIEGLRSLLIGEPVGNWHMTVGNPLNPIAVIGNLIVTDVKFEFGEELGPDDFPDELNCTVTLKHGMKRDLAAIESMFNRGAGRIYQAPDYARMFGGQPSSDQESRVDAVTGGTSSRMPMALTRMTSLDATAKNRQWGSVDGNYSGSQLNNSGQHSSQIVSPINNVDVVDYDYGSDIAYSKSTSKIRAAYSGNWATRKYVDN